MLIRNGSGKTTLLKAIVARELDGIPSHLRIMHVEQEAAGDDTSVLEWFIFLPRL